jgi:hypothetical protein
LADIACRYLFHCLFSPYRKAFLAIWECGDKSREFSGFPKPAINMRKVKVQYDMTFLATPPASQAIDEIVNLD